MKVIDIDGTEHDLAWLQEHYGAGIQYHPATEYPRFELQHVFITEGPTVLRFTVLAADGKPCVGQPVAYSFPTLGSPSADLPVVPKGADRAGWMARACIERCDPRGAHEFQIGKDSWTKGLAGGGRYPMPPWLAAAFQADQNFGFYDRTAAPGVVSAGVAGRGPYAVAVISPSTWSDCLDGAGWLGGTNHRGPCEYEFVEVLAPGGGGGEPEPSDFESAVLGRLEHVDVVLTALAKHIGVQL